MDGQNSSSESVEPNELETLSATGVPDVRPRGRAGSFFRISLHRTQSDVSSINSYELSSPLSTTFSKTSSALAVTAPTSLDDESIVAFGSLFVSWSKGDQDDPLSIPQRNLRQSIDNELLQHAYGHSYSLALRYAGDRKDKLRLAIVVATQTRAAKSIIARHLLRLAWLKQELKSQKLDLHVVLDDLRPAKSPSVERLECSRELYLRVASHATTLCGTKLVIPVTTQRPSSTCTVGGVLKLGDRFVGQTAWHPLSESQLLDTQTIESDYGLHDDLQFMEPGAPFSILYVDSDEDDDKLQHVAKPPMEERDDTSHEILSLQRSCSATASSQDYSVLHADIARYDVVGLGTSSSLLCGPDADWCTFDLTTAMQNSSLKTMLRNVVDDCLISDVYREVSSASVPITISTAKGEVHGYLRPESTLYRMGPHSYDLSLVTLDFPLYAGCSGSWVTHRNQLCGMVVVASQTIPWAYIVPATTMLEDMEIVCGVPAQLPDRDDIDIDGENSVAENSLCYRPHLPVCRTEDALFMTANLIPILELTATITGYTNGVKLATREQTKIAVEVRNLNNLLNSLRFRVDQAKSNNLWFNQVKLLGRDNGSFDRFKAVLEEIVERISSSRKKDHDNLALTWGFTKFEVEDVLKWMERLRSLIQCALTEESL